MVSGERITPIYKPWMLVWKKDNPTKGTYDRPTLRLPNFGWTVNRRYFTMDTVDLSQCDEGSESIFDLWRMNMLIHFTKKHTPKKKIVQLYVFTFARETFILFF